MAPAGMRWGILAALGGALGILKMEVGGGNEGQVQGKRTGSAYKGARV